MLKAILAGAAVLLAASPSIGATDQIRIDFSGMFNAIPHLGFGQDPFDGIVTLDTSSRTYQDASSPTNSMSIYSAAALSGDFAARSFLGKPGDFYYQRGVPCISGGPQSCSLLDINFRAATPNDLGGRLYIVVNGTGPAGEPNPTFPILSGTTVRSFTFDLYQPDGQRRSLDGGSLRFVDPNAAVPEPATWAMMIAGFALAGAASRRRTRTAVTFA